MATSGLSWLLVLYCFSPGSTVFSTPHKINISKFQFDRMQDLTETFSRLSGASLVNIINLKNLIKKIDVRLEMCISELMNISDSWCEPKL